MSIARAIISPNRKFCSRTSRRATSTVKQPNRLWRFCQNIVKENGTTLLMVTHDMEKARYADRIVYIADGRS